MLGAGRTDKELPTLVDRRKTRLGRFWLNTTPPSKLAGYGINCVSWLGLTNGELADVGLMFDW